MIESIHKYNMKTEEYKMFKIRNEIETDYKIVEDVTRKAFYNVYSPGCMEHYLVHVMRGHEVIVIFGSPANYVSCGFECCKKHNVCVEGGKYPAAMLVKELKEGALDGRKWYYSDSPVMNVDEKEAAAYDDSLEKMEKKWMPSQEAFYIMSHSFVE